MTDELAKECLDPSGSWISGGNTHKSPNELSGILRNMVQCENPEEDDDGKGIAKLYQQTGFAKAMDDNNKEALKVAAEEGMDAAVKHMFTDQKSGRQLSYAEMRSRYG